MSAHTARVRWQRQPQEAFVDQRYSRAHHLEFDGGAVVLASASPQVVRLPFSDASGVDPEEMFVAALASCHMLWFLSIAAERGFQVDAYVDDASGTMARQPVPGADGSAAPKWCMTEVLLKPAVRFGGAMQPTGHELADMHHQAHAECFIANSVRTQVRCEPQPAPQHPR